MRKGQHEVIQVAHADRNFLQFEDATDRLLVVLIPDVMEDGIRDHLVEDAKFRKAAKKDDRRFYARQDLQGSGQSWDVRDRDADDEIVGTFWLKGAEGDAKGFAKWMNKQNRKPMGGAE